MFVLYLEVCGLTQTRGKNQTSPTHTIWVGLGLDFFKLNGMDWFGFWFGSRKWCGLVWVLVWFSQMVWIGLGFGLVLGNGVGWFGFWFG